MADELNVDDHIKQLGARAYYKELKAQLAALLRAYPTLEDDIRTRDKAIAAIVAPPRFSDLTDALLAVIKPREQVSSVELLSRVKADGYQFESKHERETVSRALARLVEQKALKQTGAARGTRYARPKAS